MNIPIFQNNHFELDDGEVLHEEAPSTFHIPPIEKRNNLKKDDIVKLIFRMEHKDSRKLSIERMWVIVNSCDGGMYSGIVDNDPVGNVYLKAGNTVVFEARHVIQIFEKTSGNSPNKG